jgi:drug/metabolite transporter (DMT)-like permease
VLLCAQRGGFVAIALVVAIRGDGPASAVALLAVPAAISGTLGLYAYYRGIAVGAISVVAPIAGVSAVVPVLVGIASGEHLSALTGAGIACALVGVFLASREPGRGGPPHRGRRRARAARGGRIRRVLPADATLAGVALISVG